MGGGRIWMETPVSERFSNLRLKEAVDIGVQELVTCCPYCITNFEDSRVVLNYDEVIQVKDITEVLSQVI
jgi:Fe-S oxidoreductase